jgi:hypothetical protein
MGRRIAPDDTDRHQQVRGRNLSLTVPQRRRLSATLKNLRLLYGSWAAVAEMTEVSINTLHGITTGRDYGSVTIAARVARAAGVSFVHVLDGQIRSADRCPECGQRPRRTN